RSADQAPASASTTDPLVSTHATRGASASGTATAIDCSPTSTTTAASTSGNEGWFSGGLGSASDSAGTTASTSTRSPTVRGGTGSGPTGIATARCPAGTSAATPIKPCGASRSGTRGSPAAIGWRTTDPDGGPARGPGGTAGPGG